MPLKSHIKDDSFLHVPEGVETCKRPLTLIFFVTGNPGLISYYHTFLSLLARDQADTQTSDSLLLRTSQCVIAGYSLGGFEFGHDTVPEKLRVQDDKVYTLEEQIELTLARLVGLVDDLRDDYGDGLSVNVILIGHSLGTYITLELIRLSHLQRVRIQVGYHITAAILLAPTIMDLAHSPSGKLAVPLLRHAPFLPGFLQRVVKGLFWVVGENGVKWLVARMTGMSGQALESTTRFLGTNKGVKQALGMAVEELRDISTDKWGEEVWGVASEGIGTGGTAAPDLYFFFASKDHWVADVTREEILRTRGKGREGRMVVDEPEGLVHAWCLYQSEMVAQRVKGWVEEIMARNKT